MTYENKYVEEMSHARKIVLDKGDFVPSYFIIDKHEKSPS